MMGQLVWPCNAPKPHRPHKWDVPDWTEDDPNNYRCPGWGHCRECGRWLEYGNGDSEALISGMCQFCLHGWPGPVGVSETTKEPEDG